MIISNELIFIFHLATVSAACVIAAKLKKEALFALICAQTILSNLFVIKQIGLFGFYATATDVFTVGASLCLNLLQEKYDKTNALRAINISFFILIFYTLMTQFHIFYEPAPFDCVDVHFQGILQFMPRIIAASIFCYFISQNIDAYLYNFVNIKFTPKTAHPECPSQLQRSRECPKGVSKGRFMGQSNLSFVLKNYISISISQFVDTAMFSVLGLYGIVGNLWHVALVSYAIKLLTIITIVPLTKFAIKISDLHINRLD